MKRLILLAMAAHGVAAAAPEATLFFADEQSIQGLPVQLQKGAANELPDIVWSSPSFKEPVSLKQAKMLEMRLTHETAEQAAQGNTYALLTLNNGDSVRGELTQMDDTTVTIRTPFAGDLKFRRDMVDGLRIMQRAPVLLAPKGAEWKLEPSDGGWSTQGNNLVSQGQGTASLTLDYPERFRLGFDLEWKTGLRFHLVFLADQQQGEAGGGYDLNCQDRYVYMRKREGNNGMRVQGAFNGPTASLNDFSDKDKVHLELVADTRTGYIAMLLDGRTVQEWTDPTPIRHNAANRLTFATDDSQQLRVSRIVLSPWDGNVEALNAEDPTRKLPDSSAAQQLVLRNGDIVTAETLKIENGQAKVKSQHGSIKIPIPRMRMVAMKKPAGNPPTPKKMLGDVRAWFPDGGRITFRLDDLKDGKITGFSQQFGTAEFNLDAFERIEMNIGNLALEPQRPKLGW